MFLSKALLCVYFAFFFKIFEKVVKRCLHRCKQLFSQIKKTFQKFITQYFEQREQMLCAFVLIDSRHSPQPIDLEFMQWLGEHGIPFCIIFTKADKLKPNALTRNVEAYKEKMLEIWVEMPVYFVTSSTNDLGRDEVLKYIENLNTQFISN